MPSGRSTWLQFEAMQARFYHLLLALRCRRPMLLHKSKQRMYPYPRTFSDDLEHLWWFGFLHVCPCLQSSTCRVSSRKCRGFSHKKTIKHPPASIQISASSASEEGTTRCGNKRSHPGLGIRYDPIFQVPLGTSGRSTCCNNKGVFMWYPARWCLWCQPSWNKYVSWIGHLASTKPGGVNMKFVFETTASKTISNNGNNISWKNWKHLSWHPMSKHFVQSFLGVVCVYYKI